MTDRISLDPTQTAEISLKNGKIILYHDADRDCIIVQSTASTVLHVLPRAANSIGITVGKP